MEQMVQQGSDSCTEAYVARAMASAVHPSCLLAFPPCCWDVACQMRWSAQGRASLQKQGRLCGLHYLLKPSSQHQKASLALDVQALAAGNRFPKAFGLPSPFSLQTTLVDLNALEHYHRKVTGTHQRCLNATPSGMGFLRMAEGCVTLFCLSDCPQLHLNAS